MALLEIENLSVEFPSHNGTMHAVDGVSLAVDAGDVLGIVGESGSGKSVTMMALMGLVAFPGVVRADKLRFDGHDLLALSSSERRKLTGKDLSMIFQDPTTSLNPCFTVGFQLAETLKLHLGMDKKAARRRSIELLEQVPTTALDVTIQAQILDLLRSLQKDRGMALVLITHNMGVVSEMARNVAVMYAGQVMEQRAAQDLFLSPQHPYTEALMAAMPERSDGQSRLATIPGMVPGLYDRPHGCLFGPRCSVAVEGTCGKRPALRPWLDGAVRCHFPISERTTHTADAAQSL
ncbi:MAG: dipeptide ABC transporter ATP-binding protein DppD [Burkholderiales bacterium PBB4]|nr:MAG: dipeptide ABC transporter ATP-binding protein DppD [Burkholderiales bacterium PBB4]